MDIPVHIQMTTFLKSSFINSQASFIDLVISKSKISPGLPF